MKQELCEITCLILLTDGKRFLLQNRVKADWRGWTLPGGHVEPGESITQAAVRECREETGLTPTDLRLCGVKQFPADNGARYLVFLYRGECFTGELHSSAEGEVAWFTEDEFAGINVVRDLRDLLNMMMDPEKSEFQYLRENGRFIMKIY